jgi:protein-disulfide isomerase
MKKIIFVMSALMLTSAGSFANEPGSHPWLDGRLKDHRYPCPRGQSPVRGPEDAPVTINEFVDYECPFCGKEDAVVKQVLKAYPTQVKLVIKHLPLEKIHPDAKRKAVVVDCIGMQDKFWPAHDKLMAGVPLKKVRGMVDQGKLNALIAQGGDGQVDKDLAIAKNLGLATTPSFVIDGIRQGGMMNFQQFKLLIDHEIARKAAMKQDGNKEAGGPAETQPEQN